MFIDMTETKKRRIQVGLKLFGSQWNTIINALGTCIHIKMD